jgi:hypothetical protein
VTLPPAIVVATVDGPLEVDASSAAVTVTVAVSVDDTADETHTRSLLCSVGVRGVIGAPLSPLVALQQHRRGVVGCIALHGMAEAAGVAQGSLPQRRRQRRQR